MALGTLGTLGAVAGGAGILGGLFGGDEGGSPGGSSSIQGFAALPPEVKDAWLKQYLPQLLKQYNAKFQGTPLGQAPTGPFASQGLQELQQHSNSIGGLFGGGTGVNPLGHVEPFNQFQQNALGSMGGGLAGLQNELPGYQNLYNENVLNPQLEHIQKQEDMLQGGLRGRNAASGNLFGAGSTANKTQIAALQEQANQARSQARSQSFQGGINLRNQTLQQMLGAGSAIQGQGQQSLNALQPQLQQTAPGTRLNTFGQGLNMFPQSNTMNQTGAVAAQPNFMSKLGGAGLQGLGIMGGMGGGGMGGMFGGGGLGTSYGMNGMPQGMNMGNSMPWLNNGWGF